MAENFRNIYKAARRAAGLTQVAASMRLYVSVETLRAYETGRRIPPNDIVELMVICYDAQYLAYQHLREHNALAHRIVPTAALLYGRLNQVQQDNSLDRLQAIARVGALDDEQRAEVNSIIGDLRQIISVGLELKGCNCIA